MFRLETYMASCSARDAIRRRTLENLAATDWKGSVTVEFDNPTVSAPLERHGELVRRILRRAASNNAEMMLFLEDDLDFNLHFMHNLRTWPPLQQFSREQHFFASLCNLGIPFPKSLPELAYREADPQLAFGSQALLISRTTARYMVTCWGVEPGPHADIKLLRLAARVGPLIYYLPSLVQHVGVPSLWGGPFRDAPDFDKNWKSALEFAPNQVQRHVLQTKCDRHEDLIGRVAAPSSRTSTRVWWQH